MKYRREDVYMAFCGSFRNEELSKKLNVEIVRAIHPNRNSTLFREIIGRPAGSGAWFSWASPEPLDVSLIRQMAEAETRAWVFTLEGIPILGLPSERIHLEKAERCAIFLREGVTDSSPDPKITRLEERHLSLLDGLFDHPDTTQNQRDVYHSAYETIIQAADNEEMKSAVYGLISDGCLLSAIQASTTYYASIDFRQNKLINPFTRPDQRGKGFGKAVMNYALGLFPDETVMYEYDGENEMALKLALACGFLPILNIDLYQLDL